jgi:DNA-binding NarL/FixJ family response regulator
MPSKEELFMRAVNETASLSEEDMAALIQRVFHEPKREDQLEQAKAKLLEAQEKVREIWVNKRKGIWKTKPLHISWGDWTLEKLSDRHKQIIHLRLMGWRQSEICKQLGISKSRMSIILSSTLVRMEMRRRMVGAGRF